MVKEVYQTDHSNYFVNVAFADPDPLQPNHWLIPGGCIETHPPSFDSTTHKARWTGTEWALEEIPVPPPEPEPEQPDPNAVPQYVTPLQARKALTAQGLRTQVEEYIATQSLEVKDAWEYATQFYRKDGILVNAGSNLGMTEEEIDNLFRLAGGF